MPGLILLYLVAIPIVLASCQSVSWYDWLPTILVGWFIYRGFEAVLHGATAPNPVGDFLNATQRREPDRQQKSSKNKKDEDREDKKPYAPIGKRIYDTAL